MVLQRTIDNLKDRPRHEREAVAFWIAVAVVMVLILAWGVFFFRSLGTTSLQPVSDAYTQVLQQAQAKQNEAQKNIDDTGWVSTASQPGAAASAASEIQIIQQEDVPQVDTNTDVSAQPIQ